MKIKVYQIEHTLDKNDIAYTSHKKTLEKVGQVDPSIYKCVYQGNMNCADLEDVYVELNICPPPEYQGRALSVSDIVKVEDATTKHKPGFYFCDDFGFKNLNDFDDSQCLDLEGCRMLVVLPGREPYETRIKTDLKSLQFAVSGYIEYSYPFKDSVCVIGNDEAKLIGMPGNRKINGSIYAGPILIVGEGKHGVARDLTDEEVAKYTEMLREPQIITRQDIIDDLGFDIE